MKKEEQKIEIKKGNEAIDYFVSQVWEIIETISNDYEICSKDKHIQNSFMVVNAILLDLKNNINVKVLNQNLKDEKIKHFVKSLSIIYNEMTTNYVDEIIKKEGLEV